MFRSILVYSFVLQLLFPFLASGRDPLLATSGSQVAASASSLAVTLPAQFSSFKSTALAVDDDLGSFQLPPDYSMSRVVEPDFAQSPDPVTFTDSTGRYVFVGLPRGTHKVTLDLATLPEHLQLSGQDAPTLWINPGQALTSELFAQGVRLAAVYERVSGEISGVVFVDVDGDGRQGEDEPGLSGVRVIDPTVHQYFVPFDDRNLWTLFDEKNQCHGRVTGLPLVSFVFLTASSDGTVFYYDHWEDGYDADPLSPGSTTELGMVDAGVTKIFQSDIDINQIGVTFYYDGRDRITIVGEAASVVRMAYPFDPGVVLASAWEVPEAADWGTEYVATAGEDLDFNGGLPDDHDYAGLEVMAWQPGTDVYVNGVYAATLGPGEVLSIDGANDGAGGGGVDSDDVITSTAPIQVQMLTGACGLQWSAHGYTLQPIDVWDYVYWAPVPGFAPGCGPSGLNADTDIYIHNPHTYAIDVEVTSGVSVTTISVPPTTTLSVLAATGWPDLDAGNFGTRLSSLDVFWGISAIDSSINSALPTDSNSQEFDWGYSLIPEARLSSQVIVGYAPGNNDIPATPVNGNIAFVTAITDTRVYVDINQDGLPDPFDMNGDGDASDNNVFGVPDWDEPLAALGVPLLAGQTLRVGDPVDYDLNGTFIYVQDLKHKIAVAWGQDPCRAVVNAPYLDLGYTILPVPIPSLSKVTDLAIDADSTGNVSPGDTITYTLVLYNNGLGPMHNMVLTDTLPYTYTSFVAGSLGVTTPPAVRPFEYYESGVWGPAASADTQAFRISWDEIEPRQAVTITFLVQLDANLPPTVTEVTNQAIASSDETPPRRSEDPRDPFDPDTDTTVGHPSLAIAKSVVPSVVRPGDLMTYTVVVSNTGSGVSLDLVLSDALPTGIEYVPGTLGITWPVAQVQVTTRSITHSYEFNEFYADDFDLDAVQTTNYAGSDGSLAWSTDWTEVGDDGAVGSGEIQVQSGGFDLTLPGYLAMIDDDDGTSGVRRTVDLALFVDPVLRYYVSGNASGADDFYQVVSGTAVFAQEVYNGGYAIREVSLAAVAGSSVVPLSFLATAGMDGGDTYLFDNIAVYEAQPERTKLTTLTWESTTISYLTSTGGDPVSGPVGGLMVITQGLRLPASSVLTVTYQARATMPLTNGASLTNTACFASRNAGQGCDPASVEILSSHTLAITKTDDPDPVVPGDLLTYTLAYRAAGDDPAPNVIITDWVPIGTTFFAADGGLSIDTPPVGSRGIVTWHLGTLLTATSGITSQGGVVTLVVRVDPGFASPPISNTAYISDDSGASDRDDEPTSLPPPGLSVIKSVLPTMAVHGQTVTFTMVARNVGGVVLNPVTLTDTLPVGLSYANQAAPMEPDVVNGQTQVWNDITGGTGLAPGARLTVTFQATVDAGASMGTYVNHITGTGRHPGGVVTDTDDASVEVIEPRVDLVKTLVVHNRDAGIVTFTIIVSNTGPSTLDVLPLSDEYDPSYLSFLTADPMPSAPADDGRLDWSDLTASTNGFGVNLAPGEQFVITTVYAIIRDITTTRNVAAVTDVIDVYGNRANDAQDDEVITDIPTAIELVYFRVERFSGYVLLEWKTAIEIDHYGFYVLRGTTNELQDAVEIAFVPAAGRGRGGGATYSLKDVSAEPSVSFVYWLVEVDNNGRRKVHNPVVVPQLELPYRVYMPLFPCYR